MDFKDSAELAAENAKLRAENQRLRERLDERDRQLTNLLATFAHKKEGQAEDGVLVLYSNVKGWLWVMSKIGQFVIWLSAIAGAIYAAFAFVKTLK